MIQRSHGRHGVDALVPHPDLVARRSPTRATLTAALPNATTQNIPPILPTATVQYSPSEQVENVIFYFRQADRSSDQTAVLFVCFCVTGGQRGDVDGITDRLVARRVDDVPQGLLGVLDAPPFGVPVPQVDELLLLTRPQTSHALLVYFYHPKAQISFVQHYNLVFVGAVVQNVSERGVLEKRVTTKFQNLTSRPTNSVSR
jgi:hypothetical protein